MEESGSIIISAPSEILDIFEEDLLEALEAFVESAGMDVEMLYEDEIRVDNGMIRKGAYLELSYDMAEWANFSMAFVSGAQNVEYYSHHSNEYGGTTFTALNAKQERASLQFDQGGDCMESDSYRNKIVEGYKHWRSLVPDAIEQDFADFVDIDIDSLLF